ncbi:MarR family winged helix-turn-helix transcriptional regulator [Streptacidiphilus rugosus]|uniref:MarR family winged helix-turn-helix transcriptional regulator n=1 Tax=Streptacidiphilus rugosus TaxID=405783 RepID=UPI000563B8AC|nr:MarR family winged helix-turn-helix transcriptional regulator [Streptacidiphilus rugosus]
MPHRPTSPGAWLSLLTEELRSYFNQELARHGLALGEWGVLLAIHYADRPTVGELAERLSADPERVRMRIEQLTARGLLDGAPADPAQEPAGVVLSHEGRELVPALIEIASGADSMIFKGLTPGQRDELEGCLRQLLTVAELPAGDEPPGA